MTRSVNYVSGMPDRLLPEDVTTVPKFTEYARQELGLSYPVGKGRREGWMRFCKEEMNTRTGRLSSLLLLSGISRTESDLVIPCTGFCTTSMRQETGRPVETLT